MPSRAPELLGTEAPRLFTPPQRDLTPQTSAGFTFIDFAEDVLGLTLLPWQKWLAVHALELRDDGRFRFRTVLVLVARHNGKSTFLQALLLWRMWADRIPMALIAAQSLEKAEEVWAGAVEMAQGSPELAAEMLEPILAAGKKELRTTFGSRCKVQTANRKGGRSLSADLILLDELREHHTWDAWAALTKTTMARKNPQTWATTNAGDDLSIVLNDLRETGLRQIEDPATDFAIFEWSGADDCDLDDRQAWAQANPSLGRTIAEESIAAAKTTDPEWVFRTEVLCQRVNLAAVSPLPRWPHVREPGSTAPVGAPTGFAVDVSWDRSRAWIGAAVRLPDGRTHLEAVASDEGTEWVLPRLRELCERWSPVAVGLQASGAPASTLLGELEEFLDVPVAAIGGADLARACGSMFDAVANGTVRHPGQEPIDSAARHASIRPLSDAWVFDRKRSPVDIAGLMAEAMALWVLSTIKPKPKRTAPRRIR